MELEQVRQKKRQLEEDLTKRNDELNALKKEKASLDADLNVKREISLEVMER